MVNDELYHFGIKGMKWGVRRYRKADGTLTSAGKARYTDSGKKKNPKTMSSKDLERSTKRLQMEAAYKRARRDANSNAGSTVARTVSTSGLTFIGTHLGISLYNATLRGEGKAGINRETANYIAAFNALTAAVASLGGGRITPRIKAR